MFHQLREEVEVLVRYELEVDDLRRASDDPGVRECERVRTDGNLPNGD